MDDLGVPLFFGNIQMEIHSEFISLPESSFSLKMFLFAALRVGNYLSLAPKQS